MKQIFSYMLALWMALIPVSGAVAEAAVIAPLEGIIQEVQEDGSFLLEDVNMGQVLVHISEDTILEGLDAPAAGQYVFVTYNGAMTRSLPPQVTAQQVNCYVIEGDVISVDGQTALIESEAYGQVLVRLPDMERPLQAGDFAVVYFNGIMALSYPGQAGGLKVDVYVKAAGTIAKIEEGRFLLESEAGTIQVNIGEETLIPEFLEEGDEVVVYHNGAMTYSIPPQVFGMIVELSAQE